MAAARASKAPPPAIALAPEVTQPAAPKPPPFAVVIEMNIAFPRGAALARAIILKQFLNDWDKFHEKDKTVLPDKALARRVVRRFRPPSLPAELTPLFAPDDQIAVANSLYTDHYLFAELTEATIDRLSPLTVAGVEPGKGPAQLYKVWKDQPVERLVFRSAQTIKCDAVRAAFAAAGEGIVWAVADTGIDGDHPHFKTHKTLDLDLRRGLRHRDFTKIYPNASYAAKAALMDQVGHGTHVAGIIAGETLPKPGRRLLIEQDVHTNDSDGNSPKVKDERKAPIQGLAPRCKIMSLKVLRSEGNGRVSYLLAAIGYLQEVNENGRNLKVHGLNLSLGYPFLPRWFAAGQSPLCVEVDRLVRSGVVVVVAAGNAGSEQVNVSEIAAHLGTIADPGNAELAITVGSTHRDMPHSYGVSFFSAKGPTADGRAKPDLVAPGERIVSCARMETAGGDKSVIPFREDSGTSMAAPHVSGAVAAFLSVRGEFVGKTDQIKALFCANATDLKRRPEFQGAGLVDVLRTLQAV